MWYNFVSAEDSKGRFLNGFGIEGGRRKKGGASSFRIYALWYPY
jgi:hypothetical protein